MCPPPSPVQYAETIGLIWTYQQNITFRCSIGMKFHVYANPDSVYTVYCGASAFSLCSLTVIWLFSVGYWISEEVFEMKSQCTSEAKWDPDPSKISCLRMYNCT